MIIAETYKIITDIEKQRFEEPYKYSEFIDNTDYISPSKHSHTSSSLLVNNDSCKS